MFIYLIRLLQESDIWSIRILLYYHTAKNAEEFSDSNVNIPNMSRQRKFIIKLI